MRETVGGEEGNDGSERVILYATNAWDDDNFIFLSATRRYGLFGNKPTGSRDTEFSRRKIHRGVVHDFDNDDGWYLTTIVIGFWCRKELLFFLDATL